MKKFLLTTLLGLGLTMNATAKVALTGTFSDAPKYWEDGIKNKIFTNDISNFRFFKLHNIKEMSGRDGAEFLTVLRTLGKLCLLDFNKDNNLKIIRIMLLYYNNAFSMLPAIGYIQVQRPDLYKKITAEPLATYENKKLIIKYNNSKHGSEDIQICIE